MSTSYGEEERRDIIEAISSHRNRDIMDEKSLRGLLCRADKMSRPCFACKAEPECDWKKQTKNMDLNW